MHQGKNLPLFKNGQESSHKLITKSDSFLNTVKIEQRTNQFSNERLVMTSRDRKGAIHPGLQELIQNEDDDLIGGSQRRRRFRARDSDDDMLEESRFDPQDMDCESIISKQKDAQSNDDNNADPPFNIITSERKNYFDWNNSASGKVIEQIFKDIKINSKMNDYCRLNRIKNDFKSINIDSFIDSFKQTYPQYLSFGQKQSEAVDKIEKEEIEEQNS